LAWWIGVFAGVFEEIGVSAWCFCGQVVVDCVANVDTGTTLFESLIFCKNFEVFFSGKKLKDDRGFTGWRGSRTDNCKSKDESTGILHCVQDDDVK